MFLSRNLCQAGQRSTDGDGLGRSDAPGDGGFNIGRAEFDDVIELSISSRRHAEPPCGGTVKVGCLGSQRATAEVVDCFLVGVDVAAASTPFDAHVAHRHSLFHRHGIEGTAGEFVSVAHTTLHAQLLDDIQDDVLGVDAGTELPIDDDAADFRAIQEHGLSGQYFSHVAGADADGNGTEGPVSTGVAVAANNGHTRLSQTLFGANHVHNALAVV